MRQIQRRECHSIEYLHIEASTQLADKTHPWDEDLRMYLPHFIFCFFPGVLSFALGAGSPSLCEIPLAWRLGPATGDVGLDLAAASRTLVSADILANLDIPIPRPLPFSLPFHLRPAALKPAITTLRSARCSALGMPLRCGPGCAGCEGAGVGGASSAGILSGANWMLSRMTLYVAS